MLALKSEANIAFHGEMLYNILMSINHCFKNAWNYSNSMSLIHGIGIQSLHASKFDIFYIYEMRNGKKQIWVFVYIKYGKF